MSLGYQSLFGNYNRNYHHNYARPFVANNGKSSNSTDRDANGVKIDDLEAMQTSNIQAFSDIQSSSSSLSTHGIANDLDPKQTATAHHFSNLSPTSNESNITNMSDTFQLNDETFFKSNYMINAYNLEADAHLQSPGLHADFKLQPLKLFNTSNLDVDLPQQEELYHYQGYYNGKQQRHNSAPSFMQHHQYLTDLSFGTTATTNDLNYKHNHEEEVASNVSTNSLNQYFATPNSSISSASSSTSHALAAGSAMGIDKQMATEGNNLNTGSLQTQLAAQAPPNVNTITVRHTRQYSNTVPIDQLTSLTLRTPSTSLQLGPSRKRSLSSIDHAQQQQQQQQQLTNLPQPDFNQHFAKNGNHSPFSTDPSTSLINLDANTIASSAATAAAVCADSIADLNTSFTGLDNTSSFDQQQGTINPRQLFTTKLTTSFSSPSLSSMFGIKRNNLQRLPQNTVVTQQHLRESLVLPNDVQGMSPMNQLEHSVFPTPHNRSLSTSYYDFKTNADLHGGGTASESFNVDLVGAELDISEAFKSAYPNRGGTHISNGYIGKNRSHSHTNGLHSSRQGNTRRNSLQMSSKGKQFAGPSPQQQIHFAHAVSQQLDELKEQQSSGDDIQQQMKQQPFTGNVASLQLSPTSTSTIPSTYDEIKEGEGSVVVTQLTQQKHKRRKSSVSKSSIQAQQLLIQDQLDKEFENQEEQGLFNKNTSTSKSLSPTNLTQVNPSKQSMHSVTKPNKRASTTATTAASANLQELDPKGLLSAPVVQNENGCFSCPECDKEFKRTEHLKRHIRSVHSNIRPYHCHYCERKFSRLDNLAQHIKTHYKVDGMGNTNIVYGDVTTLHRREKNKPKKKKKQSAL